MVYKNNRPHDLYREIKAYATASFILYFLIMCFVICAIVSCACLTAESINASNAYVSSSQNINYYNNVVDSYIAGAAAACGVCVFFIICLEISALVINIIGIVKASQLPTNDVHRSGIFVLEIVCLVLSFFIGLIAWIPAAVLLSMANKAYKAQQQTSQPQINSQDPTRII